MSEALAGGMPCQEMETILSSDVVHSYARNYLLPLKLAHINYTDVQLLSGFRTPRI